MARRVVSPPPGGASLDISSALSLYRVYCLKDSYTLPTAITTAETTGVGEATLIGDPPSPTITRVIVTSIVAESGTGRVTTMLGKWARWGVLVACMALSIAVFPSWLVGWSDRKVHTPLDLEQELPYYPVLCLGTAQLGDTCTCAHIG